MRSSRHDQMAAPLRILGFVTLVLFIALTVATHEASAADLRQQLAVTDKMVRLGDLFTETGEKSEEIIFEAPLPGKTRQISAYELEKIARRHDLDWEKPAYLKRVTLLREGQSISNSDIKNIVEDRISEAGIPGDTRVNLYGLRNGVQIPVDSDLYDIGVEIVDISDRQDRFTALLSVPLDDIETKEIRVTGSIEQVTLMPVLTRNLSPGDIIEEDDLDWKNMPVRRINNRSIRDTEDIIGYAARRPLQPGEALTTSDVTKPLAVKKGSNLTVIMSNGLMTLTASGRALESGSVGEIIRIVNLKSKLTIEAEITGAGRAEVINTHTLALAGR